MAPQRRLSLSAGTLALLQRYPFPGNVRELRNVLERAALLAQLKTHSGSRAELAKKLRISERSLYRKLREIGDAPDAV